MKKLQNPEIPVPREEWDFRIIGSDVLVLAIQYEYAREVPWIVRKFDNWHRKTLYLPKGTKGLRQWNGVQIGEVLNRMRFAEFPIEIFDAVRKTFPNWLSQAPYEELFDISTFFPLPFLRIPRPNPTLLQHLIAGPKSYQRGFRIIPELPHVVPKQFMRWAEMGIHYIPVKLDFRVGKTRLKKDAAAALDKYFEQHAEGKFNLPTGAKATAPFAHLRELAAYRLRNAGLSWERALEILEKYQKDNKLAAEAELLPTYQSSGAWADACNEAEERITRLYPEPSKEQS